MAEHAVSTGSPLLSNRLYDVLKFVALIALPAIGTLYFALALLWGLPNAEKVLGTITALDTFLGAFLKASTNSYKNSDERFDGSIEVLNPEVGPKVFSLQLDSDPEELENKDEILFKVDNKPLVEGSQD